MMVTAEISYYPLTEDFKGPIQLFLHRLHQGNVSVETGAMSTSLTGEFQNVMEAIGLAMEELMGSYPSVFNIKLSNSCIIKEN